MYKSEVGRTKPWCMFWGIVDAALSVGCIVSSVVLAVSIGAIAIPIVLYGCLIMSNRSALNF